MSTLVTLFGGLIAVMVLYVLGGWIRNMPPLLRAALAGLIPLFVYFVLIVGRWPGLDVAAIHISVYLAAALVLHALSQFWRRGHRLHWAPRLLIGFFAGLTVVNASLLYISTSGLPEPIGRWWLGGEGKVYSGFSGVVTHDQGAAKAVSAALSEAHRESLLGWQVDVDGLWGIQDTAVPLVVRVRERTGLPVDNLRAQVDLRRLGASDVSARFEFDRTAPGTYEGVVQLPAGGRWLVALHIAEANDVRYQNTYEVYLP